MITQPRQTIIHLPFAASVAAAELETLHLETVGLPLLPKNTAGDGAIIYVLQDDHSSEIVQFIPEPDGTSLLSINGPFSAPVLKPGHIYGHCGVPRRPRSNEAEPSVRQILTALVARLGELGHLLGPAPESSAQEGPGQASTDGHGAEGENGTGGPWDAMDEQWKRDAVRIWNTTTLTKSEVMRSVGPRMVNPHSLETLWTRWRREYPGVILTDRERRRQQGER